MHNLTYVYIYIYRRETETEKGRHLGAKLTLLRLCRLTSIPLPCTLSTTPRAKHPNGSPRFEQTYSLSLSLPLLYRFSHLPSLSSLHFSSPLSLSLHATRLDPSNRPHTRQPTTPTYLERPSSYLQNHPLHSRAERAILHREDVVVDDYDDDEEEEERRRLKGDGERRETAGYKWVYWILLRENKRSSRTTRDTNYNGRISLSLSLDFSACWEYLFYAEF